MFRVKALVTPERKDALIYRFDARSKILCIFSAGIAAICIEEASHLLLLFAVPVAGHLSARFDRGKYQLLFMILVVGLWGVVFSQALFYRDWPRTVLATLVPEDFPLLGRLTDGIHLYREGFRHGMVQGLRFTTMTAFGLLLTWTTEPRDILLGLTRLKMPYGLAFMFITAVRFLPVLISEIATVITVQRLRGANPVRLGRHSITSAIRILTPVLANSVRRAGTLGASCESRAFNPLGERTCLEESRWSLRDTVVSVIPLAAAVALLIAKTAFWLYKTELLYVSELRWLYRIAREL